MWNQGAFRGVRLPRVAAATLASAVLLVLDLDSAIATGCFAPELLLRGRVDDVHVPLQLDLFPHGAALFHDRPAVGAHRTFCLQSSDTQSNHAYSAARH